METGHFVPSLWKVCQHASSQFPQRPRVEDHSLWVTFSRGNFVAMTLSVLDPFVSSGGSGCCAALRNERSSGVLRSGEFCEAFELVKPNAAAGRVNIATGCAQWWKGWLGVKMSTSGTGQSSTTSCRSLRKATSRILVAGDRSPCPFSVQVV